VSTLLCCEGNFFNWDHLAHGYPDEKKGGPNWSSMFLAFLSITLVGGRKVLRPIELHPLFLNAIDRLQNDKFNIISLACGDKVE
jgi:hypothetical protein